MSMRQAIRDIYMIFINDETLLRLLYYLPEDIGTGTPDPLSPDNPNILDMSDDEKWAIINDRISMTSSVSDLDTTEKCRLLFYAGRRNSANHFIYANQEIICDIMCHFNYEKDQRSMWISDRINELLVQERISSIGKIQFNGGGITGSPDLYVGYRLVYEFGSVKK